MNRPRVDPDGRRKELAIIHMGAKALGLEDDAYRDMLFAIARVRSAKDLNFEGRQAVIAHMRKSGFRGGALHVKRRNPDWTFVDNAAADRKPMLRKIIMQLKGAGRGREYVDGIIKKNGFPRLEFCDPGHLHMLVAALNYDAQRHTERTEARP